MRPEVLINWVRFALVLLAILGSFLLILAPWRPPQERPCTLREIRLGLDLCGGVTLTLEAQIPQGTSPEDRQKIMDRSISVLETRVNALGVTEPVITQAGDTRIVVQLPGTTDPEQARQLVGSTALLEFRKVVKDGVPGETFTEEIDEEVLMGYECTKPELKEQCRAYVVKREPLMTGAVLSRAEVRFNPQPDPNVSPVFVELTFNDEGAHQWRDVILQLKPSTETVQGDRLAVVLDRVVYSAPTIERGLYETARRQPKVDQSIITGRFTADEARLLAAILSAGALPTDLKIIQESIVGPSLGRDSIEKGITASWVAGVVVLAFMALYYRLSGFVAVFTQLLNLLVVVGALAGLKATLTLPGIAGLILLIGIGVDSNVLIFERMREELRLGKVARAAIDSGYHRALTTIWDSHVTTLITALILFIFGTGPIRGFATTLSLGIIINLFTVLVGTRLIFEFVKMRKVGRLSI
ncbi:MAG: protein translocase subunit SecD [Candidatus Bipolaricaulota bacterium]|nr:protein translocase subunit SecD [Candidatus Bipolaricaulota bacterium]